jgi:hypothetical protein
MAESSAMALRRAREVQGVEIGRMDKGRDLVWSSLGASASEEIPMRSRQRSDSPLSSRRPRDQIARDQDDTKNADNPTISYPHEPSRVEHQSHPPLADARSKISPSTSFHSHYPTPPTPPPPPLPAPGERLIDDPPFDRNCCSGLFDCEALSGIPQFAVTPVRTDFDLLAEVAALATEPDAMGK